MNYILASQIGHHEMLEAIFGPADKSPPTTPPDDSGRTPIQLTPQAFDSLFGGREK